MDLAAFDLNALATKGIKVNLTHPGNGLPLKDEKGDSLYVLCLGRDSDKWKQTAKLIAAQKAQGEQKQATMDDVMDLSVQIMAACTLEWSDALQVDGKKLPCSQENALILYKRFSWIAEQVLTAVSNRANYFLG